MICSMGYSRRQGGLVPDLAGKVIVQVACGSYHTISLDIEGRVYPFGRYSSALFYHRKSYFGVLLCAARF